MSRREKYNTNSVTYFSDTIKEFANFSWIPAFAGMTKRGRMTRGVGMTNNMRMTIITCPYRSFVTFVMMACLGLFIAGCEDEYPVGDYEPLKVQPQRVRQIETLELEEKVEEETQPDINEAPLELELNIEECRVMALEGNLELSVELINPSISEQAAIAERAKFEWSFFSNLNFSNTDTPTASSIAGTMSDDFGGDLGVDIPLRTGGTIELKLAEFRSKNNTPVSTVNPVYGTDLSFSISQPLLRNAGDNATMKSIRIAEYNKDITDARTKLEVIRVLADIDRTYWRLYAARRDLEVKKQQYDLSKAQYEQAKRFVDKGEMAQIEEIRAESGVAERLEGIIIAENSLRDRERELKRSLNKPELQMRTRTILVPSTEPRPIQYELPPHHLVAQAIKNRMDMLELELEIAKDIIQLKYDKNQALPLVTMGYTYNINGLGTTRDRAYRMIGDTKFEDHRVGLSLMIPLGNQAAKSNLRRSFYTRQQRLASKRNRESLIEIEVLNAIDQLEANWQRILASRQNSILTGRLFEAEKRNFELGLGTSTDVLDAQTKFADAQQAEILALTEYQIALIDLAYATGTLLGASNVDWEPIVP